MTKNSDAGFTPQMLLAVRQAGAAARLLQGRVLNEGKEDSTRMPNDNAALHMRRAALTVTDQVVQEVLLIAAAEVLGTSELGLDAEEETSTCKVFAPAETAQRSLVIDPIDGTLEYVSGQSSYSVCVGLVDSGQMRAAIVYFPARGALYLLDEQGDSFEIQGMRNALSDSKRPLVIKEGRVSNRVYVNGRVPAEVQCRLKENGLEVVDDTVDGIGAPDCILSCLTGDAMAYIAHTRQMRDILLGPIVAACPGGFSADWDGKAIHWPNSGRVPTAVFGRQDARDIVMSAL